MARKKKGRKSKAAAPAEMTNGVEETTSESTSTEDVQDESAVVHHKKFGEIRMKDKVDIENAEEKEFINIDTKPPMFFDPNVDTVAAYRSVLKGIEMLNAHENEKGNVLNCSLPDAPMEEAVPASIVKLEDECASTDTTESESSLTGNVRRSTRIRSIGILKQKERVMTGSPDQEKPVKVKSRWRRSSELEMHAGETISLPPLYPLESEDKLQERLAKERAEETEGMKLFIPLVHNEFRTERNACKEAKRMTCDCVLSKEEMEKGDMGCEDDCLNRMLFLECGPRCALGEKCANKRFQRQEYATCRIFKTEKKGFGLRAQAPIPGNSFIMEYVGEVVDQKEFSRRVKAYAKDEVKHFYFMALKGDTIIDATSRGNISRFINHSCDPNAETQKWTVNGELRIGFFSKRPIQVGEEITFDYRFQRYGKEAQKCFCEATTCRGWIGENPDDDDDESEEEDEDEEEDVEEEDEEEDMSEDDSIVKEVVVEEEKPLEEEASVEEKAVEPKEITPPKPKPPRVKKVKIPSEKKVRVRRSIRKTETPVVEDVGLEQEIQRLSITGVKNRAHTLMLSRLMIRAEDWPTRRTLLQLIRTGDEPCRRLFLDYHGLRFLHGWMLSTYSDSSDSDEKRMEILKTLKSLPIPNKTMLIDSKVLVTVEEWKGGKKVSVSLSPEGDSGGSDEGKAVLSPDGISLKSSTPTDESPCLESSDDAMSAETRELAAVLLESWSALKEVFKIPKKERIQQMKEHEREADRRYRQSQGVKERIQSLYDRYERDRERYRDRHYKLDRDREWDRGRDRRRSRDSPPSADPDWLVNSRRMSKAERRQLFALQVLREEEEARQRMQQEEMWIQHQARCRALGQDPSLHPAIDPISGGPIFFDQNTRTWSSSPPQLPPPPQFMPQFPPFPPYPTLSVPGFPIPPNAMQFPMVPYMNGPFPSPSPSLQMSPYTFPRYPAPSNIIALTPDPVLTEPTPPPIPMEQVKPPQPDIPPHEDAPVLTPVPVNAPIKLPPKWKAASDPRGFTYYYHTKERISQWEPPCWTEDEARAEAERTLAAEEESSSESSETDSDDGEELIEPDTVEVSMDISETTETPEVITDVTRDVADTTQPGEDSGAEDNIINDDEEGPEAEAKTIWSPERPSQSDEKEAAEELSDWENGPPPVSLLKTKSPAKRREGLVQERIISPRRESSRADRKRYKEVKLMLKKRKEEKRAEKAKAKLKKKKRVKRVTSAAAESSTDKRIKESFKSSIAGAIVGHLNSYRKTECKVGRITNNEDFKHLARKLTHFVMLKELKHCQGVDDLECNDSVKVKARDFVRKYMAKFGPEYVRDQQE